MSIVSEINSALHLMFASLRLRGATTEFAMVGGKKTIATLSTVRVAIFLAVQAIRIAIAVRLGSGGMFFLINTIDLPEILLNSVALEVRRCKFLRMRACVCTRVRACVHVFACVGVSMGVYTCASMHTACDMCVYTCMPMHMRICACAHVRLMDERLLTFSHAQMRICMPEPQYLCFDSSF